MKLRQRIALANPAWPGVALSPVLRRLDRPLGSTLCVTHFPVEKDGVWGVALVWCAAVSAVDARGALQPAEKWSDKVRRRARAVALDLLSGAGAPESDVWRDSSLATHLFRVLREDEVRQLDPAWIEEVRTYPKKTPVAL